MNVVRKVVRVFAELILTVGLIGLLLCVHQLWWTKMEAEAQARDRIHDIREQWDEEGGPDGSSSSPVVGPVVSTDDPDTPGDDTSDVGHDGAQDGTVPQGGTAKRGETLAILHIPRLGKNYEKPIVEGTSGKSLKNAVGHYTNTPYTGPGQVGNFALAAHRNGGAEMFRYLNRLRDGDAVVVETRTTWYTYRIIEGPYITKPEEGSVVSARPPQLNGRGNGKLITMTTCDPEWSSKNRMIYWGELERSDPKTPGSLPAALR